MIVESKLLLPPLIGSAIVVGNLLSGLPESVRIVLDLGALAILLAGFMVVGRLRAEATAARGAAGAWELERNAMVAKAERLEGSVRELGEAARLREQALRDEIAELRIEMSRLEARPTLDTVSQQIDQLRLLMAATVEAVQEVARQHSPQHEGGT